MSPRLLAAIAALCLALPTAGQALAGTHTHANPDGTAVILTLAVNGRVVRGTLATPQGQFQLDGRLDGANAVGRVLGGPVTLFFQVTPRDGQLILSVIGADVTGEPDASQIQHYDFTPTGGAVASGSRGGGGGGAAAGGFAGTFTGAITLDLERSGTGYRGTAQAQGQTFAVQATASGNRLTGTYADQSGTYPWTATLAGNRLTLVVDGQTMILQRGGVAPTPAPPAPPAAPSGALSAMGQEWDGHLRGKRLTQMESYSSPGVGGGVGGGYSSRRVLDLCRDGRFFYRDSNQMGLGGDGVSGHAGGSGGGTGQWRVIEGGGVVGLELRFTAGETTQVRLDYQNDQTLVDGVRTFVTNDNTSC